MKRARGSRDAQEMKDGGWSASSKIGRHEATALSLRTHHLFFLLLLLTSRGREQEGNEGGGIVLLPTPLVGEDKVLFVTRDKNKALDLFIFCRLSSVVVGNRDTWQTKKCKLKIIFNLSILSSNQARNTPITKMPSLTVLEGCHYDRQ